MVTVFILSEAWSAALATAPDFRLVWRTFPDMLSTICSSYRAADDTVENTTATLTSNSAVSWKTRSALSSAATCCVSIYSARSASAWAFCSIGRFSISAFCAAVSRSIGRDGRRRYEAFIWFKTDGYQGVQAKWYLPDAPHRREALWFDAAIGTSSRSQWWDCKPVSNSAAN